ncbi:MAG: sulfurtransferase [Chloroflexi bacterium]|nr:sulfurtransferase [Chloroflexota bacterium]
MSGTYADPDTLVSTEWLAAHLDDPRVRVIEIDRTRTAYESGHIPGAVFWSAYDDVMAPDRRVDLNPQTAAALFERSGIGSDTTVVFYSATHSANGLGFWYMKLFGHRDVRLLNGSRQKWVSEGRPLTTALPAVVPTRHVATAPDLDILAVREQVVESIGADGHLVVDTRRTEEHSGQWFGSKPPEGTERAGRIPGATHAHYEDALNADGTFKGADELRALYTACGITPDATITTYCAGGWRAGHTWFVLKYLLGYPNVRNYQASWYEWGNRPDTPIEAERRAGGIT